MNDTYDLKPKVFDYKRIGIGALLFILEIAFEVIIFFALGNQEFYNYQLFLSIEWLVGKIIPLIIAIVLFKKELQVSVNQIKIDVKKFLLYCLIAFGFFYLFEMATSYYQMLMDKIFKIGETTNQSAILSYFESDKSFLNIFILFVTIVIVAPLIEEIEFRKLVFDSFDKKTNFLLPSILSALLFGLVHLDLLELSLKEIAYFPVYFLPGFALALIYHYSGRNVFASFLVHATINCISFISIVSGII